MGWDTMVRQARRRPYPRTQQNAATLPFYKRPTSGNEPLRTPGPPGERKLDRVRRPEYAHGRRVPYHVLLQVVSRLLKPTQMGVPAGQSLWPGPWPLGPGIRGLMRRCNRTHPDVSSTQ